MNLKKILPYITIILGYYLLPLLISDTGSGMFILLVILPLVVALNSSIYGYKSKKIDFIYNILVSILFIPVIFIYMNSSAWVYIPGYFIVSILFNFIGKVINKY